MTSMHAAIYARSDGARSARSLQLQIDRGEALASRLGIARHSVFTDEASGLPVEGGALYVRAGLVRLREACERGEIDTIICASPCRLSRDLKELEHIRHWASIQQVRLRFLSDDI